MKKIQERHRRSTGFVLILVILASMMFAAGPPPRRYVSEIYPQTLNSNTVSIVLEAIGEVPEFVAVSVKHVGLDIREEHKRRIDEFNQAVNSNQKARLDLLLRQRAMPDNPTWLPFRTNLLVDLGSGDGRRNISFAYKYKGQAFDRSWSGSSITIQHGTPTLRIVNPTNFLSSQPTIQLQGLTSRKFEALRFDQFDSGGHKVASDEQGLGASFSGGYDFKHSDNYFTFFGVDLSPGTNKFIFRGTDEFGNEMTTNIVFVFSTAHDHTAPQIDLDWPRPNTELAGANYTIRGRLDDSTAKLDARIRTKVSSATRDALVERNGYFWIEDIPLELGANQITLTATDAAGNNSETNFTVIGSDGPVVTMDSVNPPDLWKQFIAVTGRVTPPNHDVWINGVQAKVQTDGAWSAERVPVHSPSGGTAIFGMSTVPKSGTPTNKTGTGEVLSAQASLGLNPIILNATAPACGIFRLHLSDTEGRSFVILVSTNLIDWTPVLTNSHAAASFDYTRGTTNQPCGFFKVVPLP